MGFLNHQQYQGMMEIKNKQFLRLGELMPLIQLARFLSFTGSLVGGFNPNPFEKYARSSNWIISPGIGAKISKNM